MRTFHVLVVDDDAELAAYISRLFSARGHRVSCVVTGEDAVEAMRQVRPDLVILDVNLPGIGGFEVCRQLKAERATTEIPVIMMTGSEVSPAACERAIANGADEYLAKPFYSRVLVHAVERYLGAGSEARAS
jgi:CheY-like chemotaxis protein